MSIYEAPAKLNLALLVFPPRANGFHPLESLVQTIEWSDRLHVDRGEGHDALDSDIEGNLIERALTVLRESVEVPALELRLEKEIPMEAGLGGGSSDAAAALRAAGDVAGVSSDDLNAMAARVGSDVPLFLRGGSLMAKGLGDQLEPVEPLDDFAVAVVVPDFGLATAAVYRRWDEMEGPEGWVIPDEALPPSLRGAMPMRNDLLPAALDLQPMLGDFMADVSAIWGAPVSLTGSGSACFGYFSNAEEAADAAEQFAGRGAALRPVGVKRVE